MQSDPSLPQEPQPEPQGALPVTAPTAPPKKKFNFKILFLVVLIFVVAGLGYWTYQLNTNLKAAQQSLAALQGKYDGLTAENSQLTTDFNQATKDIEQTNAELEKTNETIKTTKSDLSKSKQEASALQSKMDKAWKYVEVMRGGLEDHDTGFESYIKVLAINDSKLTELFSAYMKSLSSPDFQKWLAYLMAAVEDILKK